MKIQSRILSTLLAVVFMLGSVALLGNVSVDAAGELTDEDISKVYLQTNVFKTPEEKLASMTLMLEGYGYQLYVDQQTVTSNGSVVGTATSGEIALVETATLGTDHVNVLFSNPYDVASSKGSAMFKPGGSSTAGSIGTKEQQLMSQLIVQYQDNGTTKYLYSFADAAMLNQISISKIKNGVRMEYTIGREEFRKLVPRWIPVTSYEELIHKPLQEAVDKGELGKFYMDKVETFFSLKDPAKMQTAAEKDSCIKSYPCTDPDGENIPIYVFETNASAVEVAMVEEYIKKFCTDYTFEQMDEDHDTTHYEASDEEYPSFKMALEYSLNENGLSVRLPANGLQYNMASYTLENISILPYMGAGNTKNEGYNFYPDGSGSLFDFNLTKTNTVRGKIYGVDYAYHQISGTYQKAIRTPVYGTVATEKFYVYSYNETTEVEEDDGSGHKVTKKVTTAHTERVSNTVMTLEQIKAFLEQDNIEQTSEITEKSYKRGYLAIIEAGESLGEIETYFAGALSDYATMSNYFNPKPKDSYDISDSISVTSSSTWTVVSNRKYTGNIRIQYQLLRDEELAKTEPGTHYDASWLGMAEAYRDYLIDNGALTKLTEADVTKNIPLYMEVFGGMKTQQTVATIPVELMTPFTTFENIMEMYNELSDKGVANINFKMTGFANGGLYAKIPSSLSWVSKLGGKSGFKALLEQAKAINEASDDKQIGLYPDFDFAYCSENTLFDALSLKKDAIKTIDNRYSSKRQYSATQQKYVSFYSLAIAPSRYSKFYEKLVKNYSKYDISTISLASLGTALNSDFDEDDPYNREDSKEFTEKALSYISDKYTVMTDGGNAYTWKYVDHIINMDLDSSRYVKSACSVPFLGAVLHGYVQFAGSALNKEGDTDYALLKAIENGAGLYFVLSYQNTEELKEDELFSQNYSIQYSIWKNDVVTYYSTLNSLLADVQTKQIIGHEFLNYSNKGSDGVLFGTERVLDLDELQADLKKKLEEAKKAAEKAEQDEKIDQIASVAEASVALRNAIKTMEDVLSLAETSLGDLKTHTTAMNNAATRLESSGLNAAMREIYFSTFRTSATEAWNRYTKVIYAYQQALVKLEQLKAALALIETEKGTTSTQYTIAAAQYAEVEAWLNAKIAALGDYGLDLEDIKSESNGQYLNAFNTKFASIAAQPEVVAGDISMDIDDVKADGQYTPIVTPDGTQGDTATNADSKYWESGNNVVAVTYGDSKDAPYKTFLLNYNSYAVRVTYLGKVYTVAAGGYVMIPRGN